MKRLAVALLLLSWPASAQTPEFQALQSKLSQELNLGLACNAAMIAAQAKIKELEDKIVKLEPKKD